MAPVLCSLMILVFLFCRFFHSTVLLGSHSVHFGLVLSWVLFSFLDDDGHRGFLVSDFIYSVSVRYL